MFTWHSPDHLTIICPSPDPYLTLISSFQPKKSYVVVVVGGGGGWWWVVDQPITDPISGSSFDFTFHVWPWAWQLRLGKGQGKVRWCSGGQVNVTRLSIRQIKWKQDQKSTRSDKLILRSLILDTWCQLVNEQLTSVCQWAVDIIGQWVADISRPSSSWHHRPMRSWHYLDN